MAARADTLVLPPGWLDRLRVRTMDDGGMGSLELIVGEAPASRRVFGGCVAELEFLDADGVPVLVALNVDEEGHLFELDVWKVDFSSLLRIPEAF